MTTLQDALSLAETHWEARPGARSMGVQANEAAKLLGLERDIYTLRAADGVELLNDLRTVRKLAPKSVASYYGAVLRVLRLSGVNVELWPKAPTPPRKKAREAIATDDLERVLEWLRGKGWTNTADLGVLMRGTGLRVDIEGLSTVSLKYSTPKATVPYGVLEVTGKGGHERVIPVVDPGTMALLEDEGRLDALRGLPYGTHLRRWNKAIAACGVVSKLATFHSVRHRYASEAYRNSGGNLALVQELMGHSDPATTVRYIHQSLDEKARAV